MHPGAFSISLAVRDIKASIDFYGKLGFTSFSGDPEQGWAILKNGDHMIGLFQGMFDRNILTFNPGWNQKAENLQEFEDVRSLRKHLSDQGLTILQDNTGSESGPGSFVVEDPDGNPVLFDQHR